MEFTRFGSPSRPPLFNLDSTSLVLDGAGAALPYFREILEAEQPSVDLHGPVISLCDRSVTERST